MKIYNNRKDQKMIKTNNLLIKNRFRNHNFSKNREEWNKAIQNMNSSNLFIKIQENKFKVNENNFKKAIINQQNYNLQI